MKWIIAFGVGLLVGGTLLFGAQRYHVVRASDGVYLVPKLETSFADSYVDVRLFSFADWSEHRQLTAAIIKAKKDHLLQHSAANQFRQTMKNAVDGVLK